MFFFSLFFFHLFEAASVAAQLRMYVDLVQKDHFSISLVRPLDFSVFHPRLGRKAFKS